MLPGHRASREQHQYARDKQQSGQPQRETVRCGLFQGGAQQAGGYARQQAGQQRDWQPIHLQLLGNDQGERLLLMALSGPLERFLRRPQELHGLGGHP
jgi:hypothetical protein